MSQLQIGFHYTIKNDPQYKIYYTDDDRATSSVVKSICGPSLKASLVQNENDGSIVRINFWGIKSQKSSCASMAYIQQADIVSEKAYFYLTVDKQHTLKDPLMYVSVPYSTWEIGAATIPFKYRPAYKKYDIPSDGSVDFNAGLYCGRKWGRTRFYVDKNQTYNTLSFTLALSITPTLIELSPENTKNKVLTKTNELGLSVCGGFLLAYRDLSFGFLGGLDLPMTGDSPKWNYTRKLYIGFGIGYKLTFLGER